MQEREHCLEGPQLEPQEVELLPPDGGWGWVVVGSAFFIMAFVLGSFLSFGILFLDPLTSMGASSTTTAIIINGYIFVYNFFSTFGSAFCEVFSSRSVAFVGCVVVSVSYALLALATSPLHIFLLYSIVVAMAGGVLNTVCLVVAPSYFDRHRGAAVAVVMTGVAFGQIVIPVIIRTLINELSFRGAILIWGALVSHSCIAALMFHPLERHQKRRVKYVAKKEIEMQTTVEAEDMNSGESELDINEKQTYTDNRDCSAKNTPTSINQEDNLKVVIVIRRILSSTVQHVKVVKKLRISLAVLCLSLVVVGYANSIAQIPFAMAQYGHPPMNASWCISVSSIVNTVFRVLVSFVSDRRWFKRRLCFPISVFIAGLANIFIVLVLDRLDLVMLGMVVWGGAIATTISVFYALLQDLSGKELYPSAVALHGLFLAFTGIIVGPLFGVIRDLSSYSWSVGSCGVTQMLAAFFFVVFMPCALKIDGSS